MRERFIEIDIVILLLRLMVVSDTEIYPQKITKQAIFFQLLRTLKVTYLFSWGFESIGITTTLAYHSTDYPFPPISPLQLPLTYDT